MDSVQPGEAMGNFPKAKKNRENETYEIQLFSEGLHNFFSHFFVFHFLDCFFFYKTESNV